MPPCPLPCASEPHSPDGSPVPRVYPLTARETSGGSRHGEVRASVSGRSSPHLPQTSARQVRMGRFMASRVVALVEHPTEADPSRSRREPNPDQTELL